MIDYSAGWGQTAGVAIEAAPAPVPEPVLDRRRMNLVFVTVLLGMLLAALDQTIVSTALPTIVGDLGGAGHLSWVVSSYLLADTIATVLAGKFGDLFGRKLHLPAVAPASFVVGVGDVRPRRQHDLADRAGGRCRASAPAA